MKPLMYKALVASILVLFSLSVFGQKDKNPFVFSSIKAKNYYWNSTDANHIDSEVPEKWKDKSAVILNSSLEIQLGRKKGYFYQQNMISHKRIKIQDKAAVENFSELYFDPSDGLGNVINSHWGVKVIKKSGEEIIIDVKKDAVEVKDKNNNGYPPYGNAKLFKEYLIRYKLAVPDLEVGDIIDVYRYIHTEYFFESMAAKYAIWYDKVKMQGDYPIKNFELDLVIHRDFEMYYLPVNGAPKLSSRKKETGYKFSFLETDIDNSKATNWNYPFQDNPYFILGIGFDYNGLKETMDEVGKPYNFELTDEKIIEAFTDAYEPNKNAKNEFAAFNRMLQQKQISPKNDKEKFERYFYYIRHMFLTKHTIARTYKHGKRPYNDVSSDILDHMLTAADLSNLEYDVLLVQKRGNGKIKDILFPADFYEMLRIKMDGAYVYMYEGGHFSKYDEIPGTIEGSQAYVISSKTGKSKDIKLQEIVIPASTHQENLTSHKLTLDLSKGLQSPASAEQQVTVKGLAAYEYKEDMLNIFDYVLEENRYYNTKRWGSEEHLGKDKAMLQKINQLEKDLLKEREDVLMSRAKDMFGAADVTVENVQVHSNGNRHGEDDLSYSYKINIEEGLLKKAGPNFILDAGKLIGGQVEISDDEKQRTEDIYMPYARSFDYDITIKIPTGYTVEGLDKFNKKVENQTGGTISSATQNGNTIQLKFNKYYKHNYEQVENWPQMIEFLDAGYQFTQEKLLFRKG